MPWIWWTLVIVLSVAGLGGRASSQSRSCGQQALPIQNPTDGACGDIDIRNSVQNLVQLENCTVVEGFLHISLIDYVPQTHFDKYSFPKLREITGHLMMFRVFGLRSLQHLFPNLVVIRGQSLFFSSFALVAFEMRDLEELGLSSLTTIVRGAVRLSKNHKLCYVRSIDWGQLAQGVHPREHQFVENREERLCPNYCSSECPTTNYRGVTRRRCWLSGPGHCQKNLGCKCAGGKSCSADNVCCHPYCLGGCSGPSASDCFACKNVIYRNECMPVCPHGTYMLSERRCLLDKECLNLRPRPIRLNSGESSDNVPKLLISTGGRPSLCVYKCPTGYTDDSQDRNIAKCVPCEGFCPKVCNSTKVYSVEDSQKLMGCSKVEGFLEIQIMGGKNIDLELTKNLGSIREVTGYIKIMRSYALLTLHFFKGLEVIGGQKLAHKLYSLVIVDNTNLQEIFPEEQIKKMVIQAGRVSFHGNRKLCYYKISNFTADMKIQPQLDEKGLNLDTSNTTNGDLIPCREMTLQVTIYRFSSDSVALAWEKYQTGDDRQLINYIIHYKEVTGPVRDIFQGRDACSENEWTTIDSPPQNGNGNEMSLLHSLKPYTKYAMYVEAYTLPTASSAAMSKIVYFVSNPTVPTEPVNLEVVSDDPHELTVQWQPPNHPNGIVTHYKVFYHNQPFNQEGFERRDYCKNPMINSKELERAAEAKRQEQLQKAKEDLERQLEHKCCTCPKSQEEIDREERRREMEIYFENYLHSSIYVKRWVDGCIDKDLSREVNMELGNSGNRLRREADPFIDGTDFNHPVTRHTVMSQPRAPTDDTLGLDPADTRNYSLPGNSSRSPPSALAQEVTVYGTKVTLPNLEHFQDYNIEVIACQDTDPISGEKQCGTGAITTAQTRPDPTTDNINVSTVVVEVLANKSGEAYIKWEPPESPNGLILKYNIKYRHMELGSNPMAVTICVSNREYLNSSKGFRLRNLVSGNYSFQLNAHSLAGNGSFTSELFFSIPNVPGADKSDSSRLLIIILVAVSVLIIVGLIIYFFLKRRKAKLDTFISRNPHYLATDQLYSADEWEVPRDCIRLIKELGQGSFGIVYEGLMEDPETKTSTGVAIKTVNDDADFQERLKILREATTMKVFECHHVVKLMGVVSKVQPALVVMELMTQGDLRKYLRRCRVDEEDYPDLHPPTANQIRQMAGEIADGMAYLADKKILHRDLAARNCLVSQDGTVKIADFGMARDVCQSDYYRRDQRALLPIRWMAPESLKDGLFTTMSDIWSFGVVLWEMVTLAEHPYQGLGNEEVFRFVTEQKIMNSPLGCPVDLYNMMQRCWAYNANHRPTFKNLIEMLVPYLNDHFHEVSYFFQEVVKDEKPEDEDYSQGEEDEDIEEDMEEEEDKAEADQDFGEGGDEDGLIGGRRPGYYANSSEEEEEEEEEVGREERREEGAQLMTSSPFSLTRSPRRAQESSNLTHSSSGERSPLLLHQGDIQEPLLYPPPPSLPAGDNQRDPVEPEAPCMVMEDGEELDFELSTGSSYLQPSSRNAKFL